MVLQWAEPRPVGTSARQPLRMQVRPELCSECPHLSLIAPGEAAALCQGCSFLCFCCLSSEARPVGRRSRFIAPVNCSINKQLPPLEKEQLHPSSWHMGASGGQNHRAGGCRSLEAPHHAVPQAFARGCAAAGQPCPAQGRLQVKANRGGGNWS